MGPSSKGVMALVFIGVATVTAAPTAGARAGVVAQLFPSVAQLLPQTAVPLSAKKVSVLRWRVAQARAAVNRAAREIEALGDRTPYFDDTYMQERADMQERARAARIKELRRECGLAETQILLLKAKQRQMGLPSRTSWRGSAARSLEIFFAQEERSARVLLSQLTKRDDPWTLVRADASSLLRLGSQPALVMGYAQLRGAGRLAPHAAAIAARAVQLERVAPGLLIALDGHLDQIEPHLDEILERLDEIEPHLDFILRHLDVLAPHCGPLLKHMDALLLYADDGGEYLEPLLPYVPRFAPLLDSLGVHLALLRPHMRRLLPHMAVVAPSAQRFTSSLRVAANADILLFYFGWVLRIPWLGSAVLRLPLLPRLASFLSTRLPSRPVRGRTCDYLCDWEGCMSAVEAERAATSAADTYCAGLWRSSYEQKRTRLRGTSALLRRMR